MKMLFYILLLVAGALADNIYLLSNWDRPERPQWQAYVPNGQTQATTYNGREHTLDQQWAFHRQDHSPINPMYPDDGFYFFLNLGAGKFAQIGKKGNIVVGSPKDKYPFYLQKIIPGDGKSYLILQQPNGTKGWSTSNNSPEVVIRDVKESGLFTHWAPIIDC